MMTKGKKNKQVIDQNIIDIQESVDKMNKGAAKVYKYLLMSYYLYT